MKAANMAGSREKTGICHTGMLPGGIPALACAAGILFPCRIITTYDESPSESRVWRYMDCAIRRIRSDFDRSRLSLFFSPDWQNHPSPQI